MASLRKNSVCSVIVIICVSIVFDSQVDCLKILGIFPHTGKSHHIVFEPLLRNLAVKGHELTVVSHYPLKDTPETYKDISLAGSRHLNLHICDFDDFMFLSGVGSVLRHMMSTYELFDLGNLNCEAMTKHVGVKSLINSNETFDVILTEQFNSDCAFGIINRFKAPVIGIATHVPMPWTTNRFGLPENPSFVPSHFLKHNRRINFFDSVEALLVNTYYKIAYHINTHFLEYRFLKDGYLSSRAELDVLANNMSMLLVTTYFALHGAFPRGPNVVDIGGVHVPEKLKKLDPDIQKYLDASENGVIYFSMGSMIRGKSLPHQKLQAFQQAFRELNIRAVWKWENQTMEGAGPDIMIKEWMPQYEILNHKNVKAFIGHGGLLGLTEAAHLGVPVLTIPLFGDQFINGAAAEESGLGRVLPYEDISKESVLETLRDVLSPRMQANAKRLSAIWRDRPMPALATAVYWVEHVARHGGRHLRPVSADLPLYRYLLLDVLAFLVIVGAALVFVAYKLLSWLATCCMPKRNKPKND